MYFTKRKCLVSKIFSSVFIYRRRNTMENVLPDNCKKILFLKTDFSYVINGFNLIDLYFEFIEEIKKKTGSKKLSHF